MKNIQVIDGATNATYDVWASTDVEFRTIFPEDGQNIEFFEDLVSRIGKKKADMLLPPLWDRPVRKPDVVGIHGTLFYGLRKMKKKFYPTKRESDLDNNYSRGWKHG